MTSFMEFMIIAKATCHYAIFNAPHATQALWSVTTGHNFIHSFYSLKFQSSFLTKKKKDLVKLDKNLHSVYQCELVFPKFLMYPYHKTASERDIRISFYLILKTGLFQEINLFICNGHLHKICHQMRVCLIT